ncbi:patatin-like phospholipase family protein [Bradyrhizobium sp. USDA 223]|uniref:patatin-like phospholipase family protein n=1 Tax=Bradyrhizobium sp. USDA 223 TaxID=3156306 RepID=UPI00384CAE0E
MFETDIQRVFLAEYRAIRGADLLPDALRLTPSTLQGLTGISLSGGGIRSASFCLGVLQALNAHDSFHRFDYMSTVSGGGYIGTSLTVSMGYDNEFPFGRTGFDPGETPETQHLRDNSRYLLQDGAISAISALAIYLRGLAMNVVVILPFLLLAAGALALVTDTKTLMMPPVWSHIPETLRRTGFPLTMISTGTIFIALVAFSVIVSLASIVKVEDRRFYARASSSIFLLLLVSLFLEGHFAILRIMFGLPWNGGTDIVHISSQAGNGPLGNIAAVIAFFTPIALAIMPFLRSISEKALKAVSNSIAEALSKWTSRIVLFFLALIIPLLFWLFVLQLTYWAIGISNCTNDIKPCRMTATDTWTDHTPWPLAPALALQNEVTIEHVRPLATAFYIALALAFFLFWPILNVNANSLHQLYRDRLGRAFLFKRRAVLATPPRGVIERLFGTRSNDVLEGADTTKFSEIPGGRSPYHLINTALNVPGSKFANRRGRNADFFLFSRLFVGSEATGYVDTRSAEKITDGLNIGTAMAISGAAAAPNMGVASLRPLSPTIAFLNLRLGRWLCHPADIYRLAKRKVRGQTWSGRPGPKYLMHEAFFKSGTTVAEGSLTDGKRKGFVFLTDGGHIENLGIYELLRRRCRIIVAVDAEADEDMRALSLVQLQAFARIDLGTVISLDWKPIAERTRATSAELRKGKRDPQPGPHVALGQIDYPPPEGKMEREMGVLIYIKASLTGDENDYVTEYKLENPSFPHETTLEQLFSEKQFECYRALGEHIARRMITGEDVVSVSGALRQELVEIARTRFPNLRASP